MKRIGFYFDVISPFAYLAFEQLPQALIGCSYEVQYRPVLFAGLLKAHDTLGPAEIPAKRRFTYRFVVWRARQLGIPLKFPAGHPFNPLPLLRLAIAAALNPVRIACFQTGRLRLCLDRRLVNLSLKTMNPTANSLQLSVVMCRDGAGAPLLQVLDS